MVICSMGRYNALRKYKAPVIGMAYLDVAFLVGTLLRYTHTTHISQHHNLVLQCYIEIR